MTSLNVALPLIVDVAVVVGGRQLAFTCPLSAVDEHDLIVTGTLALDVNSDDDDDDDASNDVTLDAAAVHPHAKHLYIHDVLTDVERRITSNVPYEKSSASPWEDIDFKPISEIG